jgi:hypothetical protein
LDVTFSGDNFELRTQAWGDVKIVGRLLHRKYALRRGHSCAATGSCAGRLIVCRRW